MGGKSKPPKPPDYTPIAKAMEKQAELSNQIAREQLAWAQDAYAANQKLTQKTVNAYLDYMAENAEYARRDRERYEKLFQPLEDQLIEDANTYASAERKDMEIGRAQAQVGQQFDAARESAQRELEAYGINPSATRYAALDIGYRANEAAAKAAAGNQAALNVDNIARALRTEAINIGRGYPAQVTGEYGTAMNAGNSAVGNANQTLGTGSAAMTAPAQYMGMANQSYGQWGNLLGQSYQNQLSRWEAKQNASSGWGQALGLVGGIASNLFFEDGGAVPSDGIQVPEEVSPSRGAIPDDVPAQLTAGEFVIPREAVEWYGEKHMYSLIDKARREREQMMAQTGAIPDVGTAPNQPPAFKSGQPTALPLG